MVSSRQQRLLFFGLMAVALGAALGLVLTSLKNQIVYFYTPSELTPAILQKAQEIRLGGLVRKGSYTLVSNQNQPCHHFTITDYKAQIAVDYCGLLPDLFREGQGVIALGVLRSKAGLLATQILAKHDETYKPPEITKKIGKAALQDSQT